MPDLAVWPTDGADGSVSSEARWRKMARLWVPSGVADPLASGASMVPTLVAGPTINVTAGSCWVDGHFCELTAPASVPASANGLLVVRFSPADNRAELLYRDGASAPTQTDPTYEIVIARMTGGVMTDGRTMTEASGIPVVTTLPLNPYHHQQVAWYSIAHAQILHLIYMTPAPAPYRWVVAGGAPYSANINGGEALAAGGGYQDLATPGPDVLLTLPGIYRIRLGFTGTAAAAAAAGMAFGVLPNAGAAGGAVGAIHTIVAGSTVTAVIEQDFTLTAAMIPASPGYATIRARYFPNAGTPTWSNRWISALPIRVG